MNISIYNYNQARQYVSWAGKQFTGLSYSSEIPGGMTTASFTVPEVMWKPFEWAEVFNYVDIYDGAVEVWSGYIYALERYWGQDMGIRVDCVGNVARLNDLLTASNLSNEKGSTYINDHILAWGEVSGYITAGTVYTSDYLIPGVRDYQPFKTMREVIDDIYTFNQDELIWYVWNDKFFWVPRDREPFYVTNIEYCDGSRRKEIGDYQNGVTYSYKDLAGVVQTATLDDDTDFPRKRKGLSLSDSMTSAQALQAATAQLDANSAMGSTSSIEIHKIWTIRGSVVPRPQVMPGRLIRIEGLPSYGVDYSALDEDLFLINSVTYNHDSDTVSLDAGHISHSLPNVMAVK